MLMSDDFEHCGYDVKRCGRSCSKGGLLVGSFCVTRNNYIDDDDDEDG